ncbi:MAG: CAAX prenyl protease-related protein [Acidobacteria bacterium]|nr:CAAX prenyl protease-related protein [Acidobacteriota bacterium]
MKPPALVERHPSLAYVLPFATFLALLSIGRYLDFLGRWQHLVIIVVLAAVLWTFSRQVLSFKVDRGLASAALGVAVFGLWIAPDMLWPAYRQHWLFQNEIFGRLTSSIPQELRGDWIVLAARTLRAAVLVPIIEELFWRAWLMRWLISSDFRKLPLGASTAQAMWISALLFASEHGPYWDVGLLTGLIYNWWMVRTRSLGDLILVHGVTNLCLSLYVVATEQWQYWM